MSGFAHRPSSASASVLDGSATSAEPAWSEDEALAPHGDPYAAELDAFAATTLDASVRADRAAARKELRAKLRVVDDQYTGKRLPNMVTADELERIAATYSDIRLGRSDIEIHGSAARDPAQFKADLMDDIGDILQTESGRALVSQLANNPGVDQTGTSVHHKTQFFPYVDAEHAPNYTDAHTMSPDSLPGIGGTAIVAISPGHDIGAGDVALRSDVALYHEMVHALHFTDGTTDDTGPVGAADGLAHAVGRGDLWGIADELARPDEGIAFDANVGVDRAEHQASGIGLHADDPFSENVYRAERARLAGSRKALDGDRDMPRRKEYYRDKGAGTKRDRARSTSYRHRGRRR